MMMQQSKNKLGSIVGSIGVIVLLCIIVGGFINTLSKTPRTEDHYIFNDISECEQLLAKDMVNAKVEKYQDASRDKYLENLLYEEFFGMHFESDTLKYDIFAYEFKESDDALRYFVSVTGKSSYEGKLPLDSEDENICFQMSSGMSTYKAVFTHRNKAYRVEVPLKYAEAVHALLSSAFSVHLIDSPNG